MTKYNSRLLYKELEKLREKIKSNEKKKTGQTPVVCSDEALLNLSQTPPRTLDELKSIHGIGDVFIERYGEVFFRCIEGFLNSKSNNKKEINPQIEFTLKELEKKLININKRNKLLYLPKTTARTATDLSDSQNLIKFIFGNKSRICISKGETKIDASTGEILEERHNEDYSKIKPIIREHEAVMREKGQNFLYIAYPFVIGKLIEDNFTIRAPLVLFPIKAESTPTDIIITQDTGRDVLFNTTLLLANQKITSISNPIPDATFDEFTKENFLQQVLNYYKLGGLNIQTQTLELPQKQEKFISYLANEFPSFAKGELKLEHNAIVGRFNVIDNAIQQDFESIIKEGKINKHLNDLLLVIDEKEEENIKESTIHKEQETQLTNETIKEQPTASSTEKDIVYINNLDASQEKVLLALKDKDSLVIQGPPGTGKSQVISSLIADSVCKNKSVLMVSEKKTALDVVYSRLGYLSAQTIIIDDTNNKMSFYNQMSHILYGGGNVKLVNEEIKNISHQIDNEIDKLTKISEILYQKNNRYDASLYDLYKLTEKVNLSNEFELQVYQNIPQDFCRSISTKLYDVQKLKNKFSNEELIKNVCDYFVIQELYPWLDNINIRMNDMEIISEIQVLNSLKLELEEMQKKSFFSKIFGTISIKK